MYVGGNSETFVDSWYECYLSERKTSGYVVTIDLSNEQHKQIWGSGANKGYIPKTNEDSYRNRSLRC
ncbi:hypothetical protein PDJ95_30150 [Bacillus cereus]|nr:hypothetical protein [Bacillus cereus]